MKLTRFAALGVLTLGVGLMAAPATAMASTGSSPPRPVPVTEVAVSLRCPPPFAVRPYPVVVRPVPAPGAWIIACCGIVRYRGPVKVHRGWVAVRACPAPSLVFDMPAGGSVLTEVRGPRLFVHEAIFYRGTIYTVASVNGGQFRLDVRGKPFVNGGAAIHDGQAVVLRALTAAVFVSKPCR
jgi:hypothetical protein